MGITNPRRLAIILEDLQREFMQWASVADGTVHAASYTLRHTEEQVNQMTHRSQVIKDNVEDDVIRVNDIRDYVQTLLDKCHDAVGDAREIINRSQVYLNQTYQALELWQKELQYALLWLKRALERVRAAEIRLQVARTELAAAEMELQAAKWALSSCQSYRDDEGRRQDCSYERAQVRSAENKVEAAAMEVRFAELELMEARAEQARAEARVACCNTAVELTTEAVGVAERAAERATSSLTAAERSLESATSAQNLLRKAIEKLELEQEETDAMLLDVSMSSKLIDESRVHFGNAEKSEESAQNVWIIARQILNERIALLYQLNSTQL
jgi:chromosome segregation ATPase